MSMGGGSSGVSPIRRSSRPQASTSTPAPAAQEFQQAEPADLELPIYVSVGGGLSNQRIVKKLPGEVGGAAAYDATLQTIVKYVISPDVATADLEVTVAEAVKDRLEMPDCRLLINNQAGFGQPYNLGREHLEDKLQTYLVQKEQRTGNGPVKINISDIAVVTHDEGGYRTLDYRVR
ncbi:hypothetical protein H6503_05020 [Candidatus Woesearchaeota archaeon]|nr:hypothetical protein [Candidatus Woesearchaeota archaeon]